MSNFVKTHIIEGKHNKPILLDYRLPAQETACPVVIFVHGFKGFKDFGAFNLIADQFTEAGFAYVKLNLSHNGTTPENPVDFVDLDAFGQNNFSIELDDLGLVIDWLYQMPKEGLLEKSRLDLNQLFLIGHSRGGGLVLLKGAEDKRVQKICTWAAVSDYGGKWTTAVQKYWKETGTIYVTNGRTKQEMPLNWQLCDNYFSNLNRLSISDLSKQLKQPVLLVHGTNDQAVSYTSAEQLHSWIEHSELFTVQDANHVFDTKHPWVEEALPESMQKVVDKTIQFFKN